MIMVELLEMVGKCVLRRFYDGVNSAAMADTLFQRVPSCNQHYRTNQINST
jgi:hypothetical protein